MQSYQPPHYSSALEQAIDRHPLQVTPDTSLGEVIALMSEQYNLCSVPLVSEPVASGGSPINDESTSLDEIRSSSCVLVVHAKTSALLGVVTERNVLQLIATGALESPKDVASQRMKISEVMSTSPINLTESDEQDIFSALSLFRQHHIHHLPVLDRQGKLVGVVTPERIRQVLQPSNILRLRRVADEMSTDMVTAPMTTSVLNLAQMMSAHQVGCVVIYESFASFNAFSDRRLTPVGLVSAQDIIQAQFLGLDLTELSTEEIMGTSLFYLKPNDSLWKAHQEMQKQHLQRLLVCGDEGELLGMITQISLLRMLDPTEMYRVVKNLQQSVYQLQLEKLDLLRSRNAKLEQQVQERTAKLHEQLQRERLMGKISLQIHQYLNLDEILNTTVAEVQQVLDVDRVVMYRVSSTQLGKMVAEAVGSGWRSLSGTVLEKSTIKNYLKVFETDYVYALTHLQEETDITQQEKKFLTSSQVQACLVVPIFLDGQLWGMIAAHQCSHPRLWQSSETNLMRQLATQLAIAIQQAQLFQTVQDLNTDLEQQVQERTLQLQQKVQELQQLNRLKDDFIDTVSHELRTPLASMKLAIHMLNLVPDSGKADRYLKILESECSREINLVNDLLDLQKLEASSAPIAEEVIHLHQWLPQFIQPFHSRAEERQQVLEVNYLSDIQAIKTNQNTLERILAELLNNACKYTANQGQIELEIDCFEAVSDGLDVPTDQIQLKVSNSTEIAEQELPKIFDKFYRVPNADPWRQGGTGLGLALVQKLVEQLNGNITVTSKNSKTIFTIKLPIA
ncbi:MAG: CBS domain-containing protein [Microcoleaceae cyanobacterium]